MSYQTYQTTAVVLKGTDLKEANRYYHLLTREFGVVQASAQAVRVERSKLRYSLQELSLVEVSLVRGKEWRVVGSRLPEHWWKEFGGEREKLRLVAQFCALIARLSPGEGQNLYLFDTLLESVKALKFLSGGKRELLLCELLSVSRFLYSLGYLPLREEYKGFLGSCVCSEQELSGVSLLEKSLLRDVNMALRESHL